MNKVIEKILIVCMLFSFKPVEQREKDNTFVWRYKDVKSSMIARNLILAIARTFGPDYSFGVLYAGPRGVIGKWGNYSSFTKKEDSGSWPTRWTLDVYHKDCCIASFVLYIR